MAVDYTTDIKPLEDAGLNDAAIASWLSNIHVKDVLVTTDKAGVIDIHHMLTSKAKVLKIDKTTGAWAGDLVDFFTANANHPLEGMFEELLANAHTSNRLLYCGSDGTTGYGTTAMVAIIKGLLDAGLGNPNITSIQFQAAMDELTGGLKYPGGVAQGNLDAARAEHAAREAAAARRAESKSMLDRLKNGGAKAYEDARAKHQSLDFSTSEDHAALVRQAYIDGFTP